MCNTTRRHIIKWFCLSVLLWISVSCSKNADVPDTDVSSEKMTLNVGLKLPTRATGNEYEAGETYENYIDIAAENYRIYFFDTDNKLIARFEPSGFIVSEGSDFRQYGLLGKVPAILADYKNFKIVVFANWPSGYDDTNLIPGTTTINDICTAEWAQYDCLKDDGLDPDAGKLMPFYGVHEYAGVTFTAGQATILEEPITLLRAMAKVEVILETDGELNLSFSELRINRYNAKGYCAPKDVFHQSGYDHNGSWTADYVHTLHLVNGMNDEEEKDFAFRFVRQWNEGEKIHTKWETYLPEYQNIDMGDAYSCIKAKFDDIQAESYTIFFAQYDGGQTDNSNDIRLNIERNNIYRFTVTVRNNRLVVNVQQWKYAYDNEYTFD